jgi:gas vesicle protein
MHTTHEGVRDSLDSGRTFVLGLVCGAAVGAALGLLLAPKSGVELRRDMTNSAQRLRRRAYDAYDGASKSMADVAVRSRQAVVAGREAFVGTRESRKTGSPVTTSVS